MEKLKIFKKDHPYTWDESTSKMEKTENLELLEKGHPYVWGDQVRVIRVGRYSVVQYNDESGILQFSAYVDSVQVGHADSLEFALLLCIANRDFPKVFEKSGAKSVLDLCNLPEYQDNCKRAHKASSIL